MSSRLNREIWISKYPSIQVSKYPSIQVSKYPSIQVSKYFKHIQSQLFIANFHLTAYNRFIKKSSYHKAMPFNNNHPFLVQISVALLYFLLAIIALKFAVIDGNATLLWPSSGLALAVLITFGKRVAAGIFVGAFISGLYVGNSLFTSALIALGNTLEPLFALYLLGLAPFSAKLFHLKDYLLLVVAGSAGAMISALIGPLALVFAHFISLSDFPYTAVYWWMGDVLGVVLIALFCYCSALRYSGN
ncbi:MAG: MASE1 domain-containing protein [Gammaproteobacteria bacterium]|nr:MASE1 domain-containing protein [Gammaproteobacteria bacterium]